MNEISLIFSWIQVKLDLQLSFRKSFYFDNEESDTDWILLCELLRICLALRNFLAPFDFLFFFFCLSFPWCEGCYMHMLACSIFSAHYKAVQEMRPWCDTFSSCYCSSFWTDVLRIFWSIFCFVCVPWVVRLWLLFMYLIALVSFLVIVSRYCLEIAGANACTYTYFLKVEHWITSEEMLLVGGPLFLVLHPFCTVKRWPLLPFNQLVSKWISFWGIVCYNGWLSSSQRSPVLCPLLCCRMGLLHLCCGGCFWLCSLPFWFLCSLLMGML